MGKNIPYQGWSWVQTHPWDILQLDRDSTGFLHLSYNMYKNHWLSEISFLYGDGNTLLTARSCSSMMTSSNGNIFHVTGPLWGNSPVTGEFPSQWPVTQSFDVFFDLCLNKCLSKQLWGWWFETPSDTLWRHYNGPFNAPSTHVSSQLWRVGIVSRTFSNSNLNIGHFHNCTLNTRRIAMGRLFWLHSLTYNAVYMCCKEYRVITGVYFNCHKRLEKVRTASMGFKYQLKSYGRDENTIKQIAK